MRIERLLTALAALIFFMAAPARAQESARIDLIGAEIFGIDRSHSHLGFSIGFLGMTKVRGTFNDFTATILYDDVHPERSSVTLLIDAASIDTHNEGRDRDLQAAPWLDSANHPKITFQSRKIEAKGKNQYLVHGDLTMKGVTKPVAIPLVRTVPRGPDSGWGNIRIGGTGAVTINRRDFGVEGPEFWSKSLSDTIDVEIDLLGSRPNYDRWSYQSKEKPSIGEVLQKTVETSGGAAAAAQYRDLRQSKPNDYNFGLGQLGTLVNRLMQHRKLQDALTLLAAALEAHPDEPALHARTGEAHAALGDRPKAIAAYEKVLALNPHGTEAKEMLRRLR
ncbi:MAG TPA: YceI family protein [Thermoanaerobaculia bacterium]|nr:YceI family protein [Thermoanaerobaculia bacterium]